MAGNSVVANLRIQLSASWDKLRAGFANAGKVLTGFRSTASKSLGSINTLLAGLGSGALASIPGINLLTGAFVALDVAMGPVAVVLMAVAAAFYALRAAVGFASWGVQLAADMERVNTSFEVLTGSVNAASFLLDEIRAKAEKTPFQFDGLSETTKLLLQFGISARDVLGDLDMLSNIASGDQAKLDRLALAFGQAASAGKLMGQDLLQMINAGFNPLQEISVRTGESMLELRDRMSKGLITFEEVRQAFADATSEGGRFYQMNERQSQTIWGLWSTLKDEFAALARQLGEVLVPVIRLALRMAISFTEALANAPKNIRRLFGFGDVAKMTADQAFSDIRDLGVQAAQDIGESMEQEIGSSLESFANSLNAKFASPMQKYEEQVGKILQAFAEGRIEADIFVKAMLEAKNLIADQVKEKKKLNALGNVAYTTRNSTAGFEAVANARNALAAQKLATEIAKQQLEEDKQANLHLEELIRQARETQAVYNITRHTI